METQHAPLFETVRLGPFTLPNRIVMPPLTRSRSSQPGNVPNDWMARYYAQRAGAGFMITEGTQIEPRGQGYAWTPGIHSQAQIEGWKAVTDAVHAEGGVIFCQLWHVGRVSHRSLQPGGEAPIAPSAIRAEAVKVFVETGQGEGELAEPSEPRALTTEEVEELVALYAQAARNAMAAGFDGVELHCANGYLVNQFISEHTNVRTDRYGGSLANRLRFLEEIVEAVAGVVGSRAWACASRRCSRAPTRIASIWGWSRAIRRPPISRPSSGWSRPAWPTSPSPRRTGTGPRICRTPSTARRAPPFPAACSTPAATRRRRRHG